VIGADTVVMKQCHIGHGVQIGERCDIATGTVIAGEVTIGDDVRIGIGALIKPFVKIGDGARVGMGAVVLNDVPPGQTVVGNPARPLDSAQDAMELLREANGITAGDPRRRKAVSA
jgi:acetyltransferase-like isoleucine patch superfamily enzyme